MSVSLVAPSAQAAPPPPPTAQVQAPTTASAAAKPKYKFDVTTKGKDGEKVLRAALVIKMSKDHKKRRLDWSMAKKYFGKHTTWRDDFAAGYIGGGGKLDHAAASTKKRLTNRWLASLASAARQTDPLLRGGGTNCTGVSKDVKYSKKTERSETWYDSCDTTFLIGRYVAATSILGFASARVKGWWAAIPGMFAVITTIKGTNLAAAQANSTVRAVKYYFNRVARVGGNGSVDGQVRISVTLLSQ